MKITKIFALFSVAVAFIICNKTPEAQEKSMGSNLETVFPKGEKVPNDKFTGVVYQAILSDEGTRVSNVTFEPNGRTHWHNHPGGQTLLVTNGVGYHQEEGKPVQKLKKGDVIKVGKNVKHWHGGTESESMTHIAVSIDHEKNPSQWFEEVDEKELKREISGK